MANTENIEAKLCAYIDGELDEQGRAEIEKHLAANPQHRGLIEQLSQQRQMIRALPRERAPEEIIETLQGQLERAGLLGDDDGGQADVAAMRISRLPQIMAAAAIVLLAIGLVGIIYFVLPRQGGTNDVFVIGGSDSSGEAGAATTDEAAVARSPTQPYLMDGFARRESDTARDAVGELPSIGESSAAAPESTEPLAMKGFEAAKAPGAPAAPGTEVAAAPAARPDAFEVRSGKAGDLHAEMGLTAEIRSAQERLFSADLTRQLQNQAGGLQENAAVLFVCASDPAAANSEVTNYLVSNNIQWEPLPQGPPAPLQQADLKDMHLSKQSPARLESKSMTFRQATQSPDVTIEQTITLPPPPPATQQSDEDGESLQQMPAPDASQTVPNEVAITDAPAATQPKDGAPAQVQQESDRSRLLANNQAARQRMIIARNMTQKQAADLSESLRRQSYVQSAAVYAAPAPAPSDALATTQPIAPAATVAQQVAVAPDPTGGTGAAPSPTKREAAAETGEAEAAVLPESEPVATATAPAPTDAPAPPPEVQSEVMQPEVILPAGVSTQPVALSDEQRLDVVIVLQDDEPAAEEGAPFFGPDAPVMQQQAAPAPPATEPAATSEEPSANEEQPQQQQQPATPEPAVIESP